MAFEYVYHNENPKGIKTDDCVIRAIAYATKQSWDEVYLALSSLAFKTKRMPTDKGLYAKYLKQLGWVKCSQPRKTDNTKYTGAEFARKFDGLCIAHIGGHHIVAIDQHKILDTWDSSDGCIGNYWIKEDK